jgi:hypothetical protein
MPASTSRPARVILYVCGAVHALITRSARGLDEPVTRFPLTQVMSGNATKSRSHLYPAPRFNGGGRRTVRHRVSALEVARCAVMLPTKGRF